VLDVPDVRDALAIGPLKAVGLWTDNLHHDEGTFPRGRELVHSLGVLDTTQDQVSYVERPLAHIAVVVTT
jgi:hypothetical protein